MNTINTMALMLITLLVSQLRSETNHALTIEMDRSYLGHADPYPRSYDIWLENCHSAANAFCLAPNPKNEVRGILACRPWGTDPRSSAQGHTANWSVTSDGQTCFFNWGKQCCWVGSAVPPDIGSTDGRYCARWACGNQFGYWTRCLERGECVEEPDEFVCVKETLGLPLSPGPLPVVTNSDIDAQTCRRCCDRRADLWSAGDEGPIKKENFLQKCKQSCGLTFLGDANGLPDANDTLGIREGKSCVNRYAPTTIPITYKRAACEMCCSGKGLWDRFGQTELNKCLNLCKRNF